MNDYRTLENKVSIIILSWNTKDFLKQCIESIQKHTLFPYELIIIDQNSSDGSKEYINSLDCIKIFNQENTGFSGGNNQGIHVSKGKYVCLLNSDTTVSQNWLTEMISTLNKSWEYGLVGPITNQSGRQQGILGEIPEDYEAIKIVGFCWLIPRFIINEIGILDSNFKIGLMEDDDFCRRIRTAGYKLMVCSKAFVHHFGGKTFKSNKIDPRGKVKENSITYWKSKWHNSKEEHNKCLKIKECKERRLNLLFWSYIERADRDNLRKTIHNDPIRLNWLARGLAKQNYNVDIASKTDKEIVIVGDHIRRIPLDAISKMNYDILFAFPNFSINHLFNLKDEYPDIFKLFNEHPFFVAKLDCPRNMFKHEANISNWINERAKIVSLNTHQGLKVWQENYPDGYSFLNCNATIHDHPAPLGDPFPQTGRKRIIYIGRLNDPSKIRPINKINNIANLFPNIDFYVLTNKLKKHDGTLVTLRQIRSLYKSGNYRDIFPASNITLMPSPHYGQTFNYMYHADFALGFAVRRHQDVSSGKIWEYLGTGIPVLMEDLVPESWLFNEFDVGVKVAFDNYKTRSKHGWFAKINEGLSKNLDRKKIQEYIYSHHTWQVRAKQWDEEIRKQLKI